MFYSMDWCHIILLYLLSLNNSVNVDFNPLIIWSLYFKIETFSHSVL